MARKKPTVYLDTSFVSAYWYEGVDLANLFFDGQGLSSSFATALEGAMTLWLACFNIGSALTRIQKPDL